MDWIGLGQDFEETLSISKVSISLGVRPLDPLLGLRSWTPLGDFQDTFPFASIHPPKLPSRLRHCITQTITVFTNSLYLL